MDQLFLLFITAIATLLALLSQLLTGFGFALVIVPIVMLVAGPSDAIGMATVMGMVIASLMTWRDRKHIDTSKVKELLTGSLIGLPLGLAALTWLPTSVLKWVIISTIAAALLVVIANLSIRNRRSTTTAIGILSGTMLTATGVNGPPLVALLRANQYEPSRYRATLAAIFMVQNGVGSALLASTGKLSSQVISMLGAGILMLPLALWLGEKLFHRINAARLRQGIIIMLVLCLASVLWFR